MYTKSLLCSVALFALLAQPATARPQPRIQNLLNGKFLHVTDIHIDPTYLNGSDPKKLCHRMGSTKHNTAGVYGAVGTKCDSPVSLVEAAFGFMHKNIQDIDFIIYTGDTARHNAGERNCQNEYDRDKAAPRTVAEVLSDHKAIVNYFHTNYDTNRIKFIPTLGNNDEFVHDLITYGTQALLTNLTELWKPFNLNLGETFAKGGYYTQDILPGKLQVININTMFFSTANTLVQDCDVAGSAGAIELQWIEKNLLVARKGKYNVYLMGHIPPTDDKGVVAYYPACYTSYVNILGEYSDVIVGHFTGHTNDDMLSLIVRSKATGNYSLVPLTADAPTINLTANSIMTVLNNAPSIIPANNPAMRVYNYNTNLKEFGALTDYVQYYTDLNADNAAGTVTWQTEYSASKAYGLKGLSVEDYTGLVKGFQQPGSSTWDSYVSFLHVSTVKAEKSKV
ncbi:Metallo-dependent phosphatase-like protein [Endogone sp. FLAS-F59071]|nr:Metallo-dependent phosphatase-like protein [Endogone sp. FLAS-F59071]|eukprot:RUS13454.1 Metallo-dependent phosphatase-like protein [Endogone sp. FLAS-F59071]